MRVTRVAISCAILAMELAGCAKEGQHGTSTRRPSTTAVTVTAAPSAATEIPVSVPNDPGQRRNVQLLGCASAAGGWQATGSVHNPDNEPQTYTIGVDFTSQRFTDLGFGSIKVVADPGTTVEWRVVAQFKALRGTRCVLRGVAVGV